MIAEQFKQMNENTNIWRDFIAVDPSEQHQWSPYWFNVRHTPSTRHQTSVLVRVRPVVTFLQERSSAVHSQIPIDLMSLSTHSLHIFYQPHHPHSILNISLSIHPHPSVQQTIITFSLNLAPTHSSHKWLQSLTALTLLFPILQRRSTYFHHGIQNSLNR